MSSWVGISPMKSSKSKILKLMFQFNPRPELSKARGPFKIFATFWTSLNMQKYIHDSLAKEILAECKHCPHLVYSSSGVKGHFQPLSRRR